jgi:hypothetical protein
LVIAAALQVPVGGLQRLAEWLPGVYDTFAQAAADEARGTGYRHVRAVLHIVPVHVEGFASGEKLFYLEQALAEEEKKPYRQRILHVFEDATGLYNDIYRLKDPAAFVGAADRPQVFAGLQRSELQQEGGCRISWRAGNGDQLLGVAGDRALCASAVRGSTHVVSHSELTPETLTSLDQGLDDSNEQKWGPPAGVIGHVFVKRH